MINWILDAMTWVMAQFCNAFFWLVGWITGLMAG